jgi:hypothetical protein
MGRFIPVDPDKWAELVKAAGERDALVVEVARLKAEVERLTERNDTLSMRYDAAWALINVQTNYIERLTKAGDELHWFAQACLDMGIYPKAANEHIDRWNAAKGGKP